MAGIIKNPRKGMTLPIKLIPGDDSPRYDPAEWTEIELKEAIITEQAMGSGLPLVDLTFEDSDGKKFYAMASGRIMNALASAIKGVNLRNHGKMEP